MSLAALTSAACASSIAWAILDMKLSKDLSQVSQMGSNPSHWFWPASWVLASVKHERGGLGQSVDLVVVGKFSYREPVIPVVLPLVYEEAQELLDLLVDTFSLAIGLWVVGHQGRNFNPEYFAESSHEVRHDLGSPVTDHLFRESV